MNDFAIVEPLDTGVLVRDDRASVQAFWAHFAALVPLLFGGLWA